jgi:hypothetical protein
MEDVKLKIKKSIVALRGNLTPLTILGLWPIDSSSNSASKLVMGRRSVGRWYRA